MSLASAAGVILKPQTPLQQLLEDINFQRNKEMRQLLKDDSGFVVLQGTTYWTDLFVRHFLFQSEPVHSIDSDDLLFFVRKKHVKSSSRHMPKYETEVDVFRKDSRKLPIGDPDVDWEETVYLNMIIHQFDYTLTLAICTRTSPKELQVLRRHSQRVYASPSRRKMDTKGEGEEITYPHICFMVDNFDEVFSDILVRDGEMVCVELVANDKDGAVQGVIFLGSIRYDALRKVYDARQSSLSSKVAQRMSFGLFSSGAGVQTRCEFVRMKGPQGKGHAEMAVTKPKGSGVETPTSEPGFCATDMWDEWMDENDDYCTYRHQRRLSDPSSNLNNFSRYAWRTKHTSDTASGSGASKARSENEGLDSLANEVSEIEAGDLRDGNDLRPAFSASVAKLHTNPQCEELKNLLDKQDSTNDTKQAAVMSSSSSKSPERENIEIESKNSSPIKETTSLLDQVDVQAAIEATNEAVIVTSPTSTTNDDQTIGCGGNCFKTGKKCKKRWISSNSDKNTPQMSEVYCPTCDDFANETPACLNKMPDKKSKLKQKTILSVESELVVTKRGSLKFNERKSNVTIGRSSSLSAADRRSKKPADMVAIRKDKIKTKEKDKEEKAKDLATKDINKEKIKDRSARTSLLAKVSPKKLRNPRNSNSPTDKSKIALKNKKESSNNNGDSKTHKTNKKPQTMPQDELKKDSTDSCQEYEIADDAISLNGCTGDITQVSESVAKMVILTENDAMITVRGKEELPVVEQSPNQMSPIPLSPLTIGNTNNGGDDKLQNAATTLQYQFEKCVRVPVTADSHPLQPITTDLETNLGHNDNNDDNNSSATHPTQLKAGLPTVQNSHRPVSLNDCNGNCHNSASCSTSPMSPPSVEADPDDLQHSSNFATTLPRTKRSAAMQAFYNRAVNLVPKRRTPDGTTIYYWCDLPKNSLKELDDGSFNPLWATRGFSQSFHFWKESRRQQSTPLNAFLTYVTLPWWSIAKDLLDHRETPILTF
ncbi:hypothetical protein DOY81_006330 [Sarcophaga bullata]|nr:hypothetical protein DOY81_006330 [Sarcophaga bullata]